MSHEEWLELADIHALGALDGGDLKAMQAHLATRCVECEQRIGETSGLLPSFAFSLKSLSPPAALKFKILSRLSRPNTFRLPKPIFLALGSGAVAICVLILSLLAIAPPKDIMGHNPVMVELLKSKYTRPITFTPVNANSQMRGKLLWNSNKCGGCLMLKNFLKAPAGKIYALWAADENKKTHLLGTFDANADGHAHLDVSASPQLKNLVQFTITTESIGSGLGPVGPVLYIGAF